MYFINVQNLSSRCNLRIETGFLRTSYKLLLFFIIPGLLNRAKPGLIKDKFIQNKVFTWFMVNMT